MEAAVNVQPGSKMHTVSGPASEKKGSRDRSTKAELPASVVPEDHSTLPDLSRNVSLGLPIDVSTSNDSAAPGNAEAGDARGLSAIAGAQSNGTDGQVSSEALSAAGSDNADPRSIGEVANTSGTEQQSTADTSIHAAASLDTRKDTDGQTPDASTGTGDAGVAKDSQGIQVVVPVVVVQPFVIQGIPLPQSAGVEDVGKHVAPTFSTAAADLSSGPDARVPLAKPGTDRSSPSDLRGKRKADSSDAQPSEGTIAPQGSQLLMKSADLTGHAQRDGNPAQTGGDNVASQQAVQSGMVASRGETPSGAQRNDAGDGTAGAPPPAASPTASIGTQTTPAVSSAQLIQSMHQSEMRLGMHSQEFGNISINTSLTRQALSAQISIDHPELSRALALHLPAIEEKLGNAYGLQTRVEVRDGNASGSGDTAQQSRGEGDGRNSSTTNSSMSQAGRLASMVGPTTSLAADTTRLDIRI